MNSCAASEIIYLYEFIHNLFIKGVSYGLYHPQDQQMQWANSTQQHTKCNQYTGHTIRCTSQINLADEELILTSMKDSLPHVSKQDMELHYDRVYEESISQSLPCTSPHESHQETKTNQHHDIDILIHGVELLISICTIIDIPHKYPIEDNYHHLDENQKASEGHQVFFV